MSKTSDIGAKRLVSLSPTPWVRWLTGLEEATSLDVLSGEFQWVSRANDVLVKAHSAQTGIFLVANEIQLRPDARMPQRIRAYAALAEERYGLNVFPVVVNILRPAPDFKAANQYYSDFMGIVARQDYKVINLWEIDVNLVFDLNLASLLPFTPILKDGGNETAIKKARNLLRADQNLQELESLLAFFARFVLESEIIRQIMRWDMTVLRESPWYKEIFQEGLEEGLEEGREEGLEEGRQEVLLHVLQRRFGNLPNHLKERIGQLDAEQTHQLLDVALEAQSLLEVERFFEDDNTTESST